MNTHGLILCTSPDGWSLHPPGSTDEQIANGEALYILSGTGVPMQHHYDRAAQMLKDDDDDLASFIRTE